MENSLSGAKVLATVPNSAMYLAARISNMKIRIDLKLGGSSCQERLKYSVLGRVFFQKRNLISFNFCIIDNLVYILTLISLWRLILMSVA